MRTDWATIEINGAQRIIHRRPSLANFVLPWRRPAPWALLQPKEKAPSFLLSVRHSHGLVWEGMSNPVPVGSPRKSAGNHSLRKQNPHQRASYWLG